MLFDWDTSLLNFQSTRKCYIMVLIIFVLKTYIDGVVEVHKEFSGWMKWGRAKQNETVQKSFTQLDFFLCFPLLLSCDSEKFRPWPQFSLQLLQRDCSQCQVTLKILPYSWRGDKGFLQQLCLPWRLQYATHCSIALVPRMSKSPSASTSMSR